MAGIIEKRQNIHRKTDKLSAENDKLRNELDKLKPLANIGLISAITIHELNNIMTPIGSYAHLALNNPEDEELTKKALNKAENNIERAARIVTSMKKMLKSAKAKPEAINVSECVNNVLECIGRDFSRDGIELTLRIPEDLTATAVVLDFEHILINLIINARNAMLEKGGKLNITATSDGGATTIEITDTGPGIPKENLSRIFEPLFSDDNTAGGGGTGLGLAFCKEAIEKHNGLITVESEPNVKTRFRITFPDRQWDL